MTEHENEPEPCLHCGTETLQRAGGHPYCSMECLNRRRREEERNTYPCPYPECGWTTEYYPDSTLSKMTAYQEIDGHREAHLDAEPSAQSIE